MLVISANAELWVGLVELGGSTDNPILDGCCGAYSTYIVRCRDALEFQDAAARSAAELNLVLVKVEWSEPYSSRVEQQELDEHIYDVAREVKQDGRGRYSRFHAWEAEE